MRVALRPGEAVSVLQWVMGHILPGSGIEAWAGAGKPYPEVSGYIIPSLLAHGEKEPARRLADWLLTQQNEDGSWSGLDGKHCTFDTAACIEGMDAMGEVEAANKGRQFLRSLTRDNFTFVRFPGDTEAPKTYTARAAWLLYDRRYLAYWKPKIAWPDTWPNTERPHYIAYLLEGLLNGGMVKPVKMVCEASLSALNGQGLMPLWIGRDWSGGTGVDLCASIQFALLYKRCGMDEANDLIGAVNQYVKPNGGIPQGLDDRREISWAAKYYLDFYA